MAHFFSFVNRCPSGNLWNMVPYCSPTILYPKFSANVDYPSFEIVLCEEFDAGDFAFSHHKMRDRDVET